MSVLGVVIPTVDGREAELARAVASHRDAPTRWLGMTVKVRVERGHATCAEAWNAGAAILVDDFGDELEWLLFSADDLVADERWAWAALHRATSGRRELPAPQLFTEDGCRDPRTDDGPDGVLVAFPRVPFLPAAAWAELAPMPALHYYSDAWIGDRFAELGWTFRVTAGFGFVHLWSQAGRHPDSRHDVDRDLYARDAHEHPYRDLENRR